jgi:hypothetical protein
MVPISTFLTLTGGTPRRDTLLGYLTHPPPIDIAESPTHRTLERTIPQDIAEHSTYASLLIE